MQLRSVLFCAFALVPTLAACGDDTGGEGGGGGDSSTTGASNSSGATTPASSGAEGSGGDPAGGPGSGGGDPALSCDTYCDTIDQACTGDFAQYPGGSAEDRKASCMQQCDALPDGVYADADASLGCHQYHADAALGGPDVHCGHAGPTGDSTCGQLCENFCLEAVAVCPDVFPNAATCDKVCPAFSDTDPYSVNPASEGDTLACRAYHLSVAANSDGNAQEHCPHIASDSQTCFDE